MRTSSTIGLCLASLAAVPVVACTSPSMRAPTAPTAIATESRSATATAAAEEQTIRSYYSAWEKKDWGVVDGMLADSFTFTSANDDDHIDKRAFKANCWPQADLIDRFELESVVAGSGEAFVQYVCHTRNGKSFRNVEHFRIAGGRIASIECYFGGHQGYPSAASHAAL